VTKRPKKKGGRSTFGSNFWACKERDRIAGEKENSSNERGNLLSKNVEVKTRGGGRALVVKRPRNGQGEGELNRGGKGNSQACPRAHRTGGNMAQQLDLS